MTVNPLAGRSVVKMNGAGNAIMIIDLRGTVIEVGAREAQAIGRGDGLAFDQLMVLHDPRTPGTEAFVTIRNIDGSAAGACGNGTRCVAWHLLRDTERTRLTIETEAGRLACERLGPLSFSVDMGEPRFAWNEIPLRDPFADTRAIELQIGPIDKPILHTPSAVNMGNPHAVFWVEDIDAYDLARIGSLLESHPIFPERANISLARVVARDHILLKVWERGAGLTQACGSAACAAAVAAARKDLTGRKVTVSQLGGDLVIDWRERDGHVVMTGPVAFEFETRLPAELFREKAA